MTWAERTRWSQLRYVVVPSLILLAAVGWLAIDGWRMRSNQLNKYTLPSNHSARSMLEFMRELDGSVRYTDGYLESSNIESTYNAIRNAHRLLEQNSHGDELKLTEEEKREADYYLINYAGAFILLGKVSNPNSEVDKLVTASRQFLSSAKTFASRENQVSVAAVHVLEGLGRIDEARAFLNWLLDQMDQRPQFMSETARSTAPRLRQIAGRLAMVGQIPDLRSVTIEDRPFDLQSFRGRVVLLEFWGTHCKPCIADFPALKRIYATYRDRGFEIAGICLHAPPARIRSFVAEHQLPWIQLCDDKNASKECNQALADRFGIQAVPTTILIQADGRVAAMGVRPLSPDPKRDLEQWLANLLPK